MQSNSEKTDLLEGEAFTVCTMQQPCAGVIYTWCVIVGVGVQLHSFIADDANVKIRYVEKEIFECMYEKYLRLKSVFHQK